jgi:cGMP-dependent protein kinase
MLWAIDRKTFRKAIEEMMTKEYDENRHFIENVKFFQTMTAEQKDSLASVLFTQKFSPGQNIVSEGDPASSFYIIKDGICQVLKGTTEIRKLFKGESFGEQALYFHTTRQMTVRAQDEVKILALGRDTVQRVLGNQVQAIVFRNIQKWAMEKNAFLVKLNKVQVEKVCDNFKVTAKKSGDVIYTKGSKLTKFCIFLESSLKKGGKVLAGKGGMFGDECLLESYKTSGKTYGIDLQW